PRFFSILSARLNGKHYLTVVGAIVARIRQGALQSLSRLPRPLDQKLMRGNAGGSPDHKVRFHRTKFKPRGRKQMRHDVVFDRLPGAGGENPIAEANQVGKEPQLGIVHLYGVRYRDAEGRAGVTK